MDNVIADKVNHFITLIQSEFNKNRVKEKKDNYEERRFVVPRFGVKWVRVCYYNKSTWNDRTNPRILRQEKGELRRYCRILVGTEEGLKTGDILGTAIGQKTVYANLLEDHENTLRAIVAPSGLRTRNAEDQDPLFSGYTFHAITTPSARLTATGTRFVWTTTST